MKNGINIAGVSEFVHEIRRNKRQAELVFGVQTTWEQGAVTVAELRPLRVGTIRAGRAFKLELGDGQNERLTPEECSLWGVGGCVLITFLFAATTRKLEITSFDLHVVAGGDPTGKTDAPLYYRFDLDMAGTDKQLTELVGVTLQRSPNHRTMLESNSALVRVGDSKAIPAPEPTVQAPNSKVLCKWGYGCQIWVTTPENGSGPSRGLWLDQPKQMGGVDKGPQPQEFLLIGLSGQVVREFVRLARRDDLTMRRVQINAAATVDLHGMFAIDAEIPTRVQGIKIAAQVDGAGSAEHHQRLLAEAVAASPVYQLVTKPQNVAVELMNRGTLVKDIISSAE